MPEKAENDVTKRKEVSRLQKARDDRKDQNFEPRLPPFDGPEHVLGYFWEIGPAGSMGGPVTHSEIESWQRNTGIELDAWESRTIKRLSLDYLGEAQRATKRDHPAPWQPEVVSTEQKKQVAMTMMDMMRKMASG